MKESELTLIFFDLETTGLNPDSDEVIEIGAIKVQNNKIIGKFHSLVRPHRNIPSLVTNLTGITFEDVENAPPADEIREKFKKFIGEYPLIAHNVMFDRIFLEKFMGERLKNEFFDTLELSRLFFPEFQSHSLQNLVKALSLKKEEAHRAISDALMLYYLFEKIVEQRKLSSAYLLHRIKKISHSIRDYALIFGDDWEKCSSDEEKFVWEEVPQNSNNSANLLPFGDSNVGVDEDNLFLSHNVYIEKKVDKSFLVKLLEYARNKKLTISLYEKPLSDEILRLSVEQGISTYSLPNLNRFVCPKKIEQVLKNPDLIPDKFKMNFAILFSYLHKTRDFALLNAPTHIMKNPLLRLLSFCDASYNDCSYKDVCPLYASIDKAMHSQIVLVNHSFFLNELNLNFEFVHRDTIFLDAYRIIKAFYSAKLGFSLNDFLFFATFYRLNENSVSMIRSMFRVLDEKKIGEEANSIALELKNLFGRFKNPLLDNFFSKDKFWVEKRGGEPILFTANTKAKATFKSISKALKSFTFVSPTLGVDNKKNVIKDFTGLEGKELFLNKNENSNVLSIVPIFMHSPNREEFVEEFVYLFNKVHKKGNKAVAFFSSNEIMKRIYFLLRRRGKDIKARGIDLKGEDAEIQFYLYDFSVSNVKADEIYFVRLPNIPSVFYNSNSFNIYSAFILKNISLEIVNNNKRLIVFYFDGRLKASSFRSKFDDIFISFPLFIDRESSLFTIVSNWQNKNT